MKKIITIILLAISICGYSQNEIYYDTASKTVYAIHDNDTTIIGYGGVENPSLRPIYVLNRKIKRLVEMLPQTIALQSPVQSTSTSPGNTALNFQGVAGKQYKIELIADYQTAATTTGCIIGVSTNGNGAIRGVARGAISASAANSEQSIFIRSLSGAGSTLTTTGVSGANTPHFLHITAIINCTQSGTFGIVFGSEVSGSAAQLNQNSILIVQEL